MSLADYIPPELIELFSNANFQKALDGYFTFRIKEDPKYRESINEIVTESYRTPEFKAAVETVIITSELEIPSRLRAVEKTTGTYNFEDFEEHEPTIPEQINSLAAKIESNTPAPSVLQDPKNIIPETKTEARAVFLKDYLDKEVKERNGENFLSGNEIKDFLTKIIPERYNPEFKVTEGQNIRKIKKDVLAKAKKLFPNQLFVNKNKNGRH